MPTYTRWSVEIERKQEETEAVSLIINLYVMFVFRMILADGLHASNSNMARAMQAVDFQSTLIYQ